MSRFPLVSFMREKTNVILYGISALYLLLILMRYRAFEGSDFKVFWNSGRCLTKSLSVYCPADPSWPFLNGPLLSIFLTPLANLPYKYAFDIWFIFNAILIWFVLKSIFQLINPTYSTNQFALVFSLFVISYPIRHNLGIGSVVILILALNLMAIKHYRREISDWRSWLGALSLVFAFELKPYLVGLFIVYLLLKRNFRFLFQSFALIVFLNVLYFVALNDSNWFSWLRAMSRKSDGLFDDRTLSSLGILLRNFIGLPEWLSLTTYLASIFIILVFSRKALASAPENYQIAALLVIGPIISIYSHPQDFVLITPIALVFLFMRKIDQREFFASLGFFSLFLIISGSVGLSSYVVVVFLIVLINLANLGFTKIQLVTVFILNIGAQIFAKHLLLEYNRNVQMEFLNLLCLISGYLGWWLILSGSRMSRLRASS